MGLGCYVAGDIDSVKGFKLGEGCGKIRTPDKILPGLVKNRVGE